MNYKQDMAQCLSYIDAHITGDLKPDRIASLFGYSSSHFYRVFRICNDMSIMEYIRKRRLALAAQSISKGRKMIDVALQYGFETPSGFSKAFRKEFGCSPTQYLLQKKDTNIMDITAEHLYQNKLTLNPQIITKKTFLAAGYYLSSLEELDMDINQYGPFWLQSMLPKVWLHKPDLKGDSTYFFGPILHHPTDMPAIYTKMAIHTATYAVFSTPAVDTTHDKQQILFSQMIRDTWKYIFEEWIDSSNYRYDYEKYDFEFYDQRSVQGPQTTMDIYVPIRKK